MTKSRLVSGIQPSGHLMIGNYTGAIRHWLNLQNDHECFFFLADLHTITVRQDPADLKNRSYDVLALYLACGLDPKKSVLFAQSHVPAHTQLAWILSCNTAMGELNRMTQFKDKAERFHINVNAGLFTYPVLMAADILLYDANLVPVGDDQRQHLELTRDIAMRFNHHYGENTFVIPEPYFPPVGARLMGLQTPEKKMSKSDENEGNYIALLDAPKKIEKKIKRAVTDSGSDVRYDTTEKAGISNLLTLYSVITDTKIEDLVKQYEGKGYGAFKSDVADATVAFLEPIQSRYHEIRKDLPTLEKILKNGAEKASALAEKKIAHIYDVIGYIPSRP